MAFILGTNSMGKCNICDFEGPGPSHICDIEQQVKYYTEMSKSVFDIWASLNSPDLPDDQIDAMQVTLMRWQRANFGDKTTPENFNEHMALGCIEEFGELLGAKEIQGKSGKLDGLGDLEVYAGQLCIINRLALRPIMILADIYLENWENIESSDDVVQPECLLGAFAHTVLKHRQKIRNLADPDVYREKLTDNLAQLIAYGKLDVMLAVYEAGSNDVNDVKLNPDGLLARTYIDVANSVVLKRDWRKDSVAGGQTND